MSYVVRKIIVASKRGSNTACGAAKFAHIPLRSVRKALAVSSLDRCEHAVGVRRHNASQVLVVPNACSHAGIHVSNLLNCRNQILFRNAKPKYWTLVVVAKAVKRGGGGDGGGRGRWRGGGSSHSCGRAGCC